MRLQKLALRAAIICLTIILPACSDPAPATPLGPTSNEVTIGTQTWMTRNLSVALFRNGDTIPEAKNNEEWVKAASEGKPAWCYYKNDQTNNARYGKIYNWFAVNDPRGLAPEGWHVASIDEWNSLIQFLGGEQNAGKRLKATEDWSDPANSDNSSGFWALPSGFRDDDNFAVPGTFAMYWTSTEKDSVNARYVVMYTGDTDAPTYFISKAHGYSVRCIKN